MEKSNAILLLLNMSHMLLQRQDGKFPATPLALQSNEQRD